MTVILAAAKAILRDKFDLETSTVQQSSEVKHATARGFDSCFAIAQVRDVNSTVITVLIHANKLSI